MNTVWQYTVAEVEAAAWQGQVPVAYLFSVWAVRERAAADAKLRHWLDTRDEACIRDFIARIVQFGRWTDTRWTDLLTH